MKALGIGSAVGVFGGVASADEHGDADDESDEPDGNDGSDADEDPSTDRTVHVVRTLIRESTDPGRPADFFYEPTGLHIEQGDVIRFVFETPDHTVTSYHPAFGMQRRVPSGVGPFSSPILGWDPQSLPNDLDMPPSEGGDHGDGNGGNGDGNGGNGDGNGGNGDGNDGYGDGDDATGEGMDGTDGPRPSSWLHVFDTPGVYDLECAPHEGFGMAMRVVVGDETGTDFETSEPGELPPPRVGPVGFARVVLTDPTLEPEAIVERGRVEWMDLAVNGEPGNGNDESNGNESNGDDADGDGESNGDDGESDGGDE